MKCQQIVEAIKERRTPTTGSSMSISAAVRLATSANASLADIAAASLLLIMHYGSRVSGTVQQKTA